MLYEKDGWKVQVDVDKTQREYKRLNSIGHPKYCECVDCDHINHLLKADLLPTHIKNIAVELGINFMFPGEFYLVRAPHLYHGFFSFYGKIICDKNESSTFYWFENTPQLGTIGFGDTMESSAHSTCQLGVVIDIDAPDRRCFV